MNNFVVILSCLAAVTLANPTQDVVVEFLANGRARCRHNCNRNEPWNYVNCPPTNCPPAERNPSCGEPNCNIAGNRAVLHATPNANDYWQCVQDENWNHVAVRRPCACGTLFQNSANRCVHPIEWQQDCPGQNSQLRECVEDCPGVCDGQPPLPNPIPPPSPIPPPVLVPPPPPPNGCPCPCVPCIWWPCLPCASNCACQNQQQQRPQQPQQPWQRPQEPQQPWQRPQEPQQPWQRPQEPQQPWNRPNHW